MFRLHQMILRQANMAGFVVIVMLLGGVRPVSASDLMFRASFDDGSVEADVAGGDHTPVPGSEREPTTVSGIAGQAVELRAPERSLAYRAPGNIDLNQGSLIIWLKPVDWDRDTEGFLPLLSIGAEKGYAIHYYLYYHHFPDGSRNIDFRARHEGRELCITEREVVAKNPSVLARDEWTQLGLTWSGNQFALFVNGHQVGEQTYGLPITRPAPTPTDALWIMPNPFWREEPRPLRTTHIDELMVFSRALTPDEMRAQFRRFRSAVVTMHQQALCPIPLSASPVTIDGTIHDNEWADASRVPLVKKMDGGRMASIPAWCSFKYQEDGMLLGFEVATPHEVSAVGSGRDAALFAGDEVEVILRPPWLPANAFGTSADVYYQFAVNPDGAYAMRRAQGTGVRAEDWQWQSDYRCAAKREETRWTAEMFIPFADLGGNPEPAEPWLVQFGLHRPLAETLGGYYERWLAWSATQVSERSMFADPANMGKLAFRPDGFAVRIETLGDLNSRESVIELSVLGGNSPRAALTTSGEETELGAWSWDPAAAGPTPQFTLPDTGEGFFSLQLVEAEASEPAFAFNTAFYVKQALTMRYRCHADTNELAVRVDVSGAQDETLRRSLDEGQAKLELTLSSIEGQVWTSATFTPTAADAEYRLSFGDLPVGKYILQARMTGAGTPLSHAAVFERPSPSFLTEKAGQDRTIPAPWIPITVNGNQVSMLNRTYIFEKDPFPVSALSEGELVLSRPITLSINRNGHVLHFRHHSEQTAEVSPDRLVSQGTMLLEDGSLKLDWQRTVDYDGVVVCSFELAPATAGERVQVEGFTLEAAAPLSAARFVFPYNADWTRTGSVPAGRECAWVTNDRVGLCWFSDSDANWVFAAENKPVWIVREGEEAIIRASIIAQPVEISEPTRYVMGIVATPTKPLRPDWRSIHAEGWRQPRGQNLQSVCWMNSEGIQFTNRWLIGDLVDEEKGLKELAEYRTLGIGCVPYACGSAMPTNNPIHDFYETLWEITREGRPTPKDYRSVWRGQEFYIGNVCTNSGFADWKTAATLNFMSKYPFVGLYLDYGGAAYCDNPRHGCGVVDVFGQQRGSFNILSKREMYRRLYKIIHSCHPGGFLWTHSWLKFCPPLHSFTDLDFPGEEFMHKAPGNPYVYTDEVSPEEWQCNYNSHIRGVGIQFLSMVATTPEQMANDPARSRPMLTCLLLHDVPCNGNRVHRETIARIWEIFDNDNVTSADFVGYWMPDAVVVDDGSFAKVSYYRWPDEQRLLLIIGNMSSEDTNALFNIAEILPAGVQPQVVDAEQQQIIDLAQPLSLAARDYKILRISW